MSCHSCGCSPCSCNTPSNCPSCECADPGIVDAGRYLAVLDYKFCERRLQNGPGVLVSQVNGSGNANLSFSLAPNIPFTAYEIEEDQEVSHLVAALGSNGQIRRLYPAAGVDGWMKASNGRWIVTDLPTAVIPDPLTIQNLIVQDSVTLPDVEISGTLDLSSLSAGTITTAVGLDSSGNLVQQTGANPFALKVAMYYESSSLVASARPNTPISRNAYAIIGNEIYDTANLATVTNQQTIRIDVPGEYEIVWMGCFNPENTGGKPSLYLEINGITVAYPNGRDGTVSSAYKSTFSFVGEHVATLAANDVIKLLVNTSAAATQNELADVKLVLRKFA